MKLNSVKIFESFFFGKTQAVFVFLLSHQLLPRLLTQTRTSERLGEVSCVCVCVCANMWGVCWYVKELLSEFVLFGLSLPRPLLMAGDDRPFCYLGTCSFTRLELDKIFFVHAHQFVAASPAKKWDLFCLCHVKKIK